MTQTGGEKELILGNKQLISLFFIVVALCGVFFAMGYMVRGNSLKGSVTTADNSAAPVTDTLKRQQPEPPRETIDSPPTAAPTVADAPPTETHPADDTVSTAPVAGASLDPKPFSKTDPKPELKPEALEAGATYVQVVSLPLANAEATVRSLREQHFSATMVASTVKEGLFRVMVGPYHQTSDVSDAKQRLKTLGFSSTIVQKQ